MLLAKRERAAVQELGARFDTPTAFIALALVAYGLTVLWAATSGIEGGYAYLVRQLLWAVAGLGLGAAFALIDIERWRAHSIQIFGAIVFLLVLVFLFEPSSRGAQRWILVGPFTIQPSEFAKVMLMMVVAAYFASAKGEIGWRTLRNGLGILALPAALIFFQPDLGTTLVLVAIFMGLMLVAGARWYQFAALIAAGLILFGVGVQFSILKEYQLQRIFAFVNADNVDSNEAYALRQSEIAIGSGGFSGKGLFSSSSQTDLGFLPEHHTDFIFAVVGERLGFLGTSVLLILYALLVVRALRVASLARSLYGSLLAAGIAAMWTFQILVNVGMTVGLMPVTGIPLPFISYGGSSLLTNMVGVGILLSIYARR